MASQHETTDVGKASSCCLHHNANKDEKVRPFSCTTFETAIRFAQEWIKFKCSQTDIALGFLATTRSNLECAQRDCFGFHRYCYQQFTRNDR